MTTPLQVVCVDCNTKFILHVNQVDLDKWRKGDCDIQDVMTYLSPGERELLESGICRACFDRLFTMDVDHVIIDGIK